MKWLNNTTFGANEIERLNYTISNVPMYRENSLIENEKDLKLIKIYSKEDLRTNWNKCISENVSEKDLVIDYTSGSTGKPFKIGRTSKDINIAKKNIWKYRNSFLNNAVIEKHVEFGRNMRYFIQNPDKLWLIKGNTLFIKGVLSLSLIEEYVKILNDFQPKWMLGPASFLAQFVELAEKVGKLNINPAFIENAGEFLYPDTKNYLQDYFKCPVVNHYGSRELWPVALECKCGNMHILEKNVFVEIINANEDGFGEMLLTSLQIESMPLLRYRIGDIGRIRDNDCDCGSQNKILELIGARTNDYAEGKDGKKVGAFFFSTIFVDRILRNGYKGILSWRVIQNDYDDFDIFIVRGDQYKEEIEQILVDNIRKEFPDASICFKYVDKIDLCKNGKMKYFINNILKK